MDREAWHAVLHGVAKSRTRLSDCTELTVSMSVCMAMCLCLCACPCVFMSVGVCAHLCVSPHTHTCVLGPCPGEGKVRILVPHPPWLLFPPSVCCALTLPTPPTSRMASRRGQPLAQMRRPQRLSHTVEFNPDRTRVTMEHQRWRSPGDPDHSPLGQGRHRIRKERPWAALVVQASPCPLSAQDRGQRQTTEADDRGNCKRGAWLSQAEGVWRKRGVAQPGRRGVAEKGRGSAMRKDLRFWRQMVTHDSSEYVLKQPECQL